MKRILASVLSLFLLGACTSDYESVSSRVGNQFVEVEDQYRPLRVCLLAAAATEVMTDRIQLFDAEEANEALGRLIMFQTIVAHSKTTSPLWPNTDMADISLTFARVMDDAGVDFVLGTVTSGLDISTFLGATKRVVVLSVKGTALLRDIDLMFAGLTDDADNVSGLPTYTEDQVWDACHERMAANEKVLNAMIGSR